MTRTAKLARVSICPCGEPVLEDHIEVGTEYVIHPEHTCEGFTYRCGSCGHQQKVTVILVNDRITGEIGGPLPIGLFDLEASA